MTNPLMKRKDVQEAIRQRPDLKSLYENADYLLNLKPAQITKEDFDQYELIFKQPPCERKTVIVEEERIDPQDGEVKKIKLRKYEPLSDTIRRWEAKDIQACQRWQSEVRSISAAWSRRFGDDRQVDIFLSEDDFKYPQKKLFSIFPALGHMRRIDQVKGGAKAGDRMSNISNSNQTPRDRSEITNEWYGKWKESQEDDKFISDIKKSRFKSIREGDNFMSRKYGIPYRDGIPRPDLLKKIVNEKHKEKQKRTHTSVKIASVDVEI